jgi:RNA polymerase sigma-70 factor (family 1)
MGQYHEYSDDQLTELFCLGDDAAFKEIYHRYDKLLYLYAYNKLGSKEEARDVIHDVFAWLLNNRQTLGLKTTLSGYLYKSVLNKVFNIYKRKQIFKNYADSGDGYIDIDSVETDYLIREKDIRAIIEREIASMPPRMREIYELRRKSFMTAKEIADQLDIAESTVNTQMKRAMKHLRVKLGLVIYLLYIINIK